MEQVVGSQLCHDGLESMEDTSLYNTGSQCVFKNIGVRCSKGLPFGYVCANHAELLIGRIVESRLINMNGSREKRLYVKLTRYNIDYGLLLFPYNLEEEKREVLDVPGVGKVLKGTFCLDGPLANQMVQRMVAQFNFNREDEKRFAAVLNSLLGMGIGFFPNACANLSYFVDYAKNLHKIKPRLQQCYMEYDEDEQGNTRYVSLDTLPAFYQGLLYNVEMSTIVTEKGRDTLLPTMAYDVENHKFIVNTKSKIYVCKDDATDGTPLVLKGIRQSSILDPFNIPDQENARYVGFNDVQPICRGTAGERIVYSF